MKSGNIITFKDIKKDYVLSEDLTIKVLKGINLSILNGDFTAITGKSGSGKSTLMNILGLLDIPTSGKYILNGVDVSSMQEDELARIRNKEIGFIFQSFNLLARSTALENVILPAVYAGVNENERISRAKELLTSVGLSDKINNRPNQLSGGQQQRVAIARSLMNNPNIILADEPTGNLDTKSGNDIMDILKLLNKEGKTIIIITHEPDIARQTKKIIHMDDGMII